MSLEENIYRDYVAALKAKDKKTTDFLSFVRAGLKNCAIDLRKDKLDDAEVINVLRKQKKSLDDTRESIVASGRNELLSDIERELALLNQYLPGLLSDLELEKIVRTTVEEIKATSPKDMGMVMKAVLAKVAGKAESKQISQVVKKVLEEKV